VAEEQDVVPVAVPVRVGAADAGKWLPAPDAVDDDGVAVADGVVDGEAEVAAAGVVVEVAADVAAVEERIACAAPLALESAS
jgi:hypothetical protein